MCIDACAAAAVVGVWFCVAAHRACHRFFWLLATNFPPNTVTHTPKSRDQNVKISIFGRSSLISWRRAHLHCIAFIDALATVSTCKTVARLIDVLLNVLTAERIIVASINCNSDNDRMYSCIVCYMVSYKRTTINIEYIYALAQNRSQNPILFVKVEWPKYCMRSLFFVHMMFYSVAAPEHQAIERTRVLFVFSGGGGDSLRSGIKCF